LTSFDEKKNLKKLYVLMLCIGFKAAAYASTDSTQIKQQKIQPQYRDMPSNVFVMQFLGETPTIGVILKRVIRENDSWSTEIGFGVGVKPKNEAARIDQKVSMFTYSHMLTFIKKTESKIEPSIGYSGILYSGNYNKNKLFNLNSG
jgi:hypothetical protein